MKTALWYPYAQHKTMSTPLKVKKAEGCIITLEDDSQLIDAISSWWCTIHGYSDKQLIQAAHNQNQKFSHIMLGGLTHYPAELCAQKLVDITPNGLNHVFFSDSGSVGVEVAYKMAVQYWKNKGQSNKTTFIALKNAYHGDTTGAMALTDPDEGMHTLFNGALIKHHFIDINNNFENTLKQLCENQNQTIAGFICEPILQGAGGMQLLNPATLRKAKEICDQYNILTIYDEVFTGFGRTGTVFASEQIGITPDIMVLGKGLTGGFIGLAATMATSNIFNAFYHDDYSKAFMHGPTFMGNPTACAVALESITLFYKRNYLSAIQKIESILTKELKTISHSKIKNIRIKGAMACIEVFNESQLKGIEEFAQENGVFLRPFNRFLYTTPAYIISEQELLKICSVIKKFFQLF